MDNPSPTEKHFNNLVQFRQALYERGFTKRRDAQFELLDALLLAGPIRSFPQLSLAAVFRRRWPSAYSAIEDGRQDTAWLKRHLCDQLPTQGVCLFALDSSAWPRPKAPTLPDRQYVHTSTSAIDGGAIVVGYPYSLLSWVVKPKSSWALPVDIQRIRSARTPVEVGVAQVKQLCKLRSQYLKQSFHVFVADASYGNHRFLRPLKDQGCGVLVRLRRDRVLYRTPGPYCGRGRPRSHGERFAFKEPSSWGQPDQHLTFPDPHWGSVEIRCWTGLHAREAPDTPFAVLRICVHQEKARPPDALWLAWQGKALPADVLWRYYQWRWPIEPATRFRKQQLYWTKPQFQTAEASDRWTMLVSLAQWELYLSCPLVADRPLPWQKAQVELTPGRVSQGLGAIFAQIGTPAAPCQTRGKSPGWSPGRPRRRPERYPVVKKGRKKPKSARKAA